MSDPINVFALRRRTRPKPLDLSDFKIALGESGDSVIITQISTGSRAFVTSEHEMDFKNDHRPVWLPSRVRSHARTLIREAQKPHPDPHGFLDYEDYAYDPAGVI